MRIAVQLAGSSATDGYPANNQTVDQTIVSLFHLFNDDFGKMIMLESQQSGQKPEKIVKELQKDQNRLGRMRSEIMLSKTMELIIESSEREIIVPDPKG